MRRGLPSSAYARRASRVPSPGSSSPCRALRSRPARHLLLSDGQSLTRCPRSSADRGGAVAGAVLGSLETGVVVVVAEVRDIIRADPETAARAGWSRPNSPPTRSEDQIA